MTAKELAIKEAYGEEWDIVKAFVNQDGWFSPDYARYNLRIQSKFLENKMVFGNRKFRPLSISGIENNNGWIKIESSASLPKAYGIYEWFTKSRNTTVFNFEPGDDIPESITHWRSIDFRTPLY